MLLKNQLIIKEKIYDEILNGETLIFLEGNSGSGKTYITDCILEDLKQNKQIDYFKIEGDSQLLERDLYPFFKCLNEKKIEEDKKYFKKIAPKAFKSFPYVGEFSEAVIDSVINRKEEHFKTSNSYLSIEEKNILYRLQYYMSEDKNYIFNIENIHWWDKKSLDLLYQMFKEKDSNLNFLKNSIFLMTFTLDQESQNKEVIKKIREKFDFSIFRLDSVDKKDYKEALTLLGIDISVSNDLLNALYSSTGGHLHLTKGIILHINAKSQDTSENLTTASLLQINNFIETRLERFGADGELITDVLKYASIIGLSFTYLELENATKKRREEIKRLVEGANKLHLVEIKDKKVNFAHEIIRELFYNKLNENSASYYQACAECLQLIKPNEYKTRATYLLKSGQLNEAATLYLIYYLSKLRKKEVLDLTVEAELELSIKELQAEDFMENMIAAYNLYNQQNFEKAILHLNFIENFYSSILLAERDYLLALCLSKKVEHDSRKKAVEILNNYKLIDSVNNEGEIWSRILSLQIISYIHVNNKTLALECEKQLMHYFRKQKDYDIDIEDKINILRRKASAIHSIELATRSTQKSVEYFGPAELGGAPLNPIEYYYALNNHVANLMVSGAFNEGHNCSKLLLKFIESNPNFDFPRTEIAINNYIITGYLTKKVTAIMGIQRFEDIFQNSTSSADNILMKNNQAALLACNGELDASRKAFLDLKRTLQEKSSIEIYYEYCVNSNLLIVEHLYGNYESAKILFSELSNNPVIGEDEYYKKRQLFLEKIITKDSEANLFLGKIIKLNVYDSNGIYGEKQIQQIYQQGFLFSDIQFWSES